VPSLRCRPNPSSGDAPNLGRESPTFRRDIELIHFYQLKYYDQWLQVLREVQKVVPSTVGSWEEEGLRLRAVCKVYRNLADGPKSLRNPDDTFMHSGNTLDWKNKTGEMVAKLKPFSEFLMGAGVT
jgi:hypothetical protein